MNKIFFTSDTHFNQQRTLDLSKRPFKDLDEMNNTIITNWNNIIGTNDIVIHCGDFGEYDFIKQLNGKVILIYGNYEMKDSDKEGVNEFYNRLKSLGFYSLKPSGSVVLPINEELSFNFCHKPTDANPNYFNVFGHVHGLSKVKKFGLNVGVDTNFFRPYSLEDILYFKNAIENFYDNDVFINDLNDF